VFSAPSSALERERLIMLRAMAISAVILASGVCRASAVVVSFDDLTSGLDLTGSGYAGLTWVVGNAGVSSNIGYWRTPLEQKNNYPHSPPRNVINAWGCTEIGIGFPSAVAVEGAYIAAQGDPIAWTPSLTVRGYLGGQFVASTSAFTTIGTSPAWFNMDFVGVDRIVFETVPVWFGGGGFGMDDLTFTYVPEPAGLPAIGLLHVWLLRRRWRRERVGRELKGTRPLILRVVSLLVTLGEDKAAVVT
jgi:hypothetical protein